MASQNNIIPRAPFSTYGKPRLIIPKKNIDKPINVVFEKPKYTLEELEYNLVGRVTDFPIYYSPCESKYFHCDVSYRNLNQIHTALGVVDPITNLKINQPGSYATIPHGPKPVCMISLIQNESNNKIIDKSYYNLISDECHNFCKINNFKHGLSNDKISVYFVGNDMDIWLAILDY